MKKLFSYLLLSSLSLPFVSAPAKADTNYHVNNSDIIEIFKSTVSGSTTSFERLTTFTRPTSDTYFVQEGYWYDESLNKLFFQEKRSSGPTGTYWVYDLSESSWSSTTSSALSQTTASTLPNIYTIGSSYSGSIWTNTSNISTNTSNISTNTSNISTNTSNISTNTSNISTNTSNISTNTSNISTNTSNISTNTSNISTNTSNISTNTSNISTNTSNIKNLGEGVAGSTALTAALTALPQTSKESKLSCGVGTGAYSSRYAIGFGCASKVNERVDINAGGSYVFGGSKSYGSGTLDSGVVKAGFVFKLGELNKPTQISFNDKKIINKKISDLEENNKNLKAKNDEIISQNQKLLARLEKIENIALKIQSSSELISVATKD